MCVQRERLDSVGVKARRFSKATLFTGRTPEKNNNNGILIESIHLYAYKHDNSRIQIAGRRANLLDHPEQALENI
jgi:hypothetical protein